MAVTGTRCQNKQVDAIRRNVILQGAQPVPTADIPENTLAESALTLYDTFRFAHVTCPLSTILD